MEIEVFFDCSSPWTYLCFERIQPLVEEFGGRLVWRPILVGAIFNAINPGVEFFERIKSQPKAKTSHFLKDLQDWARATGITVNFPPRGHPINSVKAMRACLVLEPEGMLVPFARACFEAYFGEERAISDDDVLAHICDGLGIDSDRLLTRIAQPEVKAALRANVNEAIARGAFGSPTIFLNRTDMYFGVDRLQLLRVALERGEGR